MCKKRFNFFQDCVGLTEIDLDVAQKSEDASVPVLLSLIAILCCYRIFRGQRESISMILMINRETESDLLRVTCNNVVKNTTGFWIWTVMKQRAVLYCARKYY